MKKKRGLIFRIEKVKDEFLVFITSLIFGLLIEFVIFNMGKNDAKGT